MYIIYKTIKTKIYFRKSKKQKNNLIKFQISLKFKFFCLISLFFFIISVYIINNQNYEIVHCTVAKEENRYIKEYVDYYLNYRVNKIFIYDNNDRNGE